MRHFISQRGIRNAAARAMPLALGLGIGSFGAIAPAPREAVAQDSAIAQGSFVVLDEGDQGETVVRLQQRLAELGLFSGEATGFYGPLTADAVMRYQAAQGLLADGVAGPETLGALLPRSPGVQTIAPQGNSSQSNLTQSGSRQLDNRQLQTVQTQLSRLGFYLGEVDGLYGPQTEAAINSFQSIYALPVTGATDPVTLATLDRVYSQADRQAIDNSVISNSGNGGLDSRNSATGGQAVSQVGFGSSPSFPSATTQTRISTTSITLPPAIPSGPSVAANIPQTTIISSPLPPPSLPSQSNFGSGNFGNPNFSDPTFGNPNFSDPDFGDPNFNRLPPLSNSSRPIRQSPQLAAAPGAVGFPYVVAIPVKTGATLNEVRQAAGNAFLAGSKRGTYIQAGAYNSREDAERATQILRDRRLDARVIYRPQ